MPKSNALSSFFEMKKKLFRKKKALPKKESFADNLSQRKELSCLLHTITACIEYLRDLFIQAETRARLESR